METEKIDTKVKWYQADEDTQERYMTWEQEIQLAREDAAEAAAEKERKRSQKIIDEQAQALTEKDREIAELKAKLAEMQK